MKSYERQRRATEFAQINRLQDQGQEKRRKERQIDISQIKTFEYLIQDPETAWVEKYIALVKSGKRREKYGAAGLEDVLEGAVIPAQMVYEFQKVFGGKRKELELGVMAADLGCTAEEAATVLAFMILLDEKYTIVNVLKHPDLYEKMGIPLPIERLRNFFKDEALLNAATHKAFERSVPVLSKQATIQGVQHIVRYLRVFQFHPNKEKLRQAFGTERRQAEFKAFMRSNVKEGLLLVDDYEYLFGPLAKEGFLDIFPEWKTSGSPLVEFFARRFKLEVSKEAGEPEGVAVPGAVVTAARPNEVAAQTVFEPAVKKEAEQLLGSLTPPQLRQTMRWGAVALSLLTAGGAGGGLLAWKLTHEPDQEKYVAILGQSQAKEIRSDNFSPENKEYGNRENFAAVPELRSMRVTEVYTTPEVAGLLVYEPEAVFEVDPTSLNEENSTQHVVAERFFAQGAILYPPEMGMIDETSIVVSGHTPEEYTVIPGKQGHFQVNLKEPSSKPLEVVYTVRVATQDTLPYAGELPAWPHTQVARINERASELNLVRKPGEDDLTFAVRAETTLQSKYRYPKTEHEKRLPFTLAQELFIADCDVTNQDLLTVLISQGVHAEMVVDTSPVPGRESHGQIRALTYSEELDGYLVTELDATPHQYTKEGEAALIKRSSTKQVETEEEAESPLHQALEELIDQYQEAQTGETTTQPATRPVVQPEGTPMRPIEPREWRALGGGINGYAEYVLKHSFSLPHTKEARMKLTTELAAIMIQELQRTKVIPEGADPYEWSRHIGQPEAEAMLKAIDGSDLISGIVTHLPKYER